MAAPPPGTRPTPPDRLGVIRLAILLGGEPQRYLTGLLFLVMAFLLLPLRPRA